MKRMYLTGFLVTLVLLACFPVFLFCVSDYNPFEDDSNSRAVFVEGFEDGDTVGIFSTETLVVAVAVGELLEKFTIHTESNRFFEDSTIFAFGGRLGAGPYRFLVSFYDTGWHKVSLYSFRENDDEVVESYNVYARSPLKQESISGSMGDSIDLATEPVDDRDVLYHWSFGRSVIVTSVPPSTRSVIRTSGSVETGELWVTDLSGKYASPKSGFFYTLTDNEGPVITSANEGSVGKDTVIASEKDFFFKAYIRDYGSGTVYGASADNQPFDIITNDLFVKKIASLDTLPRPWPLIVRAIDPFSNQTEKIFWLLYDSTLAKGNPPGITVRVPFRDSILTPVRDWIVIGEIVNYSSDSLDFSMCVEVNGKVQGDTLDVMGSYSADWSFPIHLASPVNKVKILVLNSKKEVVTEKQFVMIYDPDFTDTLPPVLVELTVDGKQVQSGILSVEKDSALMRIVAFDEGKGIRSVSINDVIVRQTSPYIWEKKVGAAHSEWGTLYEVEITDSTGRTTSRSVVLRQNRPPQIVDFPDPPLPFIAGGVYEDNLIAVDADNDLITYTKMNGPPSLTINQTTGRILWTPALTDTGTWQVSISVKDLFEAVPYTFAIRVVDSSGIPDPVRFSVSKDDFPELLEADKDSLRKKLATVAGTGKPPLRLKVVRKAREETEMPVVDGWLIWKPSVEDTGFHQFVITVTDSFKNVDAIYPSLRVVPPNRQFSLSVDWKGEWTPDSSLDLSRTDSIQDLIINISDPDSSVEIFSAFRTLGGESTAVVVDLNKIILNIDPLKKTKGLDTLTISVTDKAGHSDSVKFLIYYGTPPEKPVAVYPDSASVIKDSSVTFRWSCFDPDGGSLSYDLFLAIDGGPFFREASGLTDTVYTIEKLLRAGTYQWKVTASDIKSSATGDISYFIMDQALRVRFETSIADFPGFMETDDELIVILRTKDGTGSAPFSFKATANCNSVPVLKDTLKYSPETGDTGYCNLIITVSDSAGNGDTLRVLIHIVPPNRPFTVSDDVVLNGRDELDLSAAVTPETLTFVISDPDPSDVEQYTVVISLLNSRRIESAGPDGIIKVILDPFTADKVRDTLEIEITDRGGNNYSIQYAIYYGLPPNVPSSPLPADNGIVYSSDVSLFWSGGDPDNNPITYTLFYGLSGGELTCAGALEDTSYYLPEIQMDTIYRWQVVSFDGRDSVKSPVWTFRTRSQLCRVYFNTTVSGANVLANIIRFPVKIELDSNIDFSSISTPSQLRFEKVNGTALPFEIEKWSPEEKSAVIWVLLDTVYGNNGNQYIVMDYSSEPSLENSAGVFGDFRGVWHMTPESNTIPDASGRKNDGTLVSIESSNITKGIAGSAISIDSARYVDIGNRPDMRLGASFTVEAWVYPNMGFLPLGSYQPIISKGNHSYHLEITNDTRKVGMVVHRANTYNYARSNAALQNSTWYHVAGVYENNRIQLYVNGVLQTEIGNSGPPDNSTYSFQIGHDAEVPDRWFRGIIDEVRISSSARSGNWLKLCYENGRPGSNFVKIVP